MPPRKKASPKRKVTGLGFLAKEARHGFLVQVPKGSGKGDLVSISEHRGDSLDGMEGAAYDETAPAPQSLTDPGLRVVIDRCRWLPSLPLFGQTRIVASVPMDCRMRSS